MATRSCKSDRQCNNKMQKDDSTNNGQYNTTQKAKDYAYRTPQKNKMHSGAPER